MQTLLEQQQLLRSTLCRAHWCFAEHSAVQQFGTAQKDKAEKHQRLDKAPAPP
jgi:hypothetical protein